MQRRNLEHLAIDRIENLVFQGGSVKGIAYLGAWEALLQLGLKPEKIQRVGGTSAGSITALLLALGYTNQLELHGMLDNLVFREMLDEDGATLPLADTALKLKDKISSGSLASKVAGMKLGVIALPAFYNRIQKQGGLFDGNYLKNWFEQIIKERTGIDHCTFAQLHQLKNEQPHLGLKDLYVVAFNYITEISQKFSIEDTPDAVIADCVRASMSIPFAFKPHMDHGDGGVHDNYPLFLFDHIEHGETTLGFQLLSPEKIDLINNNEGPTTQKRPDYSVFGMAKALLVTRGSKQMSDHINNPDHRRRSVQINTDGVKTFDFDLSEEAKQMLIESGRSGVLTYFNPSIPVPPSVVLAEMKNRQLKNHVKVYVWTSAVNPVQPGHAFGHVAIQTPTHYISLWPEVEDAPQVQENKRLQNSSSSHTARHRFQPSLAVDIIASHDLPPSHEFTFEKLNVALIEAKFLELKQSMTGWAVIPGLCSNNESCSSIAMKLLEAGGIYTLLNKTDLASIASVGSSRGVHSMFHRRADQAKAQALAQGSSYAAEMLASPLISSPDAMIELLKIASRRQDEKATEAIKKFSK